MDPEPAKLIRPLAKRVSPIKAVVGVGVAVEDRVVAVGAAAILLGTVLWYDLMRMGGGRKESVGLRRDGRRSVGIGRRG